MTDMASPKAFVALHISEDESAVRPTDSPPTFCSPWAPVRTYLGSVEGLASTSQSRFARSPSLANLNSEKPFVISGVSEERRKKRGMRTAATTTTTDHKERNEDSGNNNNRP